MPSNSAPNEQLTNRACPASIIHSDGIIDESIQQMFRIESDCSDERLSLMCRLLRHGISYLKQRRLSLPNMEL